MNFYGALNSIRLLYYTYDKWGNKYSESISVPIISHFGFFLYGEVNLPLEIFPQ